LSSEYVPADGSTPMTAIVELRTADGQHRGDLFEANRLTPVILVDEKPMEPPPQIARRAPGVWFYTWNPPPGLGGSRATFGAKFDGKDIVAHKSVPIAPDRWTAKYPSYATGSTCSFTSPTTDASKNEWWTIGGLAVVSLLTLRRRRNASPLLPAAK
jgi:hypothetical protein